MFRLAVLIFMCQVGASLISFSSTTPAFACTRPPSVAFAQDRCSASGTRGIEKSAFSVVDTSFQGFQTSGYYPSNHSCSDGDIRIISMVVFMWKFERQESCSLSHMYSTLVDWHSSPISQSMRSASDQSANSTQPHYSAARSAMGSVWRWMGGRSVGLSAKEAVSKASFRLESGDRAKGKPKGKGKSGQQAMLHL